MSTLILSYSCNSTYSSYILSYKSYPLITNTSYMAYFIRHEVDELKRTGPQAHNFMLTNIV